MPDPETRTWAFDESRPPRYYRLVDRHAIPCKSYAEWIDAMTALKDPHLAYEEIGGMIVSTVFLGINMALIPTHMPPQIFETAILYGQEPFQVRSARWEEAMHAHAVAVEIARGWMPPADQA
jgi:hypothetical protein